MPVVDLGEDFDLTEIIGNSDTSMNEEEDKLNENREKKKVSLEAWSKGHVTGLKVKLYFDFRISINFI